MPAQGQGKKRKSSSLRLDLPAANTQRPPAISALFFVRFDNHRGPAFDWQGTSSGLKLDGKIDHKIFPSGLNDVDSDVVYFIHEEGEGEERKHYAGIGAFASERHQRHERGALQLSVGALVPLDEGGRLKASWKHASALRDLAKKMIIDHTATEVLEQYWEEYREGKKAAGKAVDRSSPQAPGQEQLQPDLQAQGSTVGAMDQVSEDDPLKSFPALMETFGPLIYPVYKAALLRQRILLSIQAPFQISCHFVYILSLISEIPAVAADLPSLDPLPTHLQPLFCTGVHEHVDLIERGKDGPAQLTQGWIACTADSVLASKTELYDMMVVMPSPQDASATRKVWPVLMKAPLEAPSRGKPLHREEIKANRRDLRRYRNLSKHVNNSNANSPLSTHTGTAAEDEEDGEGSHGNDDNRAPLIERSNRRRTLSAALGGDRDDVELDNHHIEPTTWSALAYSGYLWWTSSGERGAPFDEEAAHDAAMLADNDDDDDNAPYSDAPALPSSNTRNVRSSSPVPTGTPEAALIEYFHNMTVTMFIVLSRAVNASNDDDDASSDGEGGALVEISDEDMTAMGLDPWSASDKAFVADLLDLYWGRMSSVRAGEIKCCGIRVC